MFVALDKYEDKGHFFLTKGRNLKDVWNAPADKSGVYLVYALKKGRIELVYIGRSGMLMPDGHVSVVKSGLGGLKERIVNGQHLDKVAARIAWPAQIRTEKIEALDIY